MRYPAEKFHMNVVAKMGLKMEIMNDWNVKIWRQNGHGVENQVQMLERRGDRDDERYCEFGDESPRGDVMQQKMGLQTSKTKMSMEW